MDKISLDRVLGGGLRLSCLRGIFYDAKGEEVGAIRDEIEFHPDGTFEVFRDWLHGGEGEYYQEVPEVDIKEFVREQILAGGGDSPARDAEYFRANCPDAYRGPGWYFQPAGKLGRWVFLGKNAREVRDNFMSDEIRY